MLVVASVAVMPLSAHAQTAQTTSPSESERSRTLFRQGAAAMKDGKYAEARKALQEAWIIRRTYDVAAILGQAELELKLYRDAAEHLDFALRNIAPRESIETLEKIQAGLQTAKQQVGELRVSVNEPKARITVDGQTVGISPLDGSLFVASGPHTIEARLDDDRVARQGIQASIGTAYSIDLVIPERRPASPGSGLASPSPIRPAGSGDEQPSLVPVAIGGGLVLTGLAMGIGFRVAASSNKGDVDAFQAKHSPDACSIGAASAGECEAQNSAASRVDSQRNISTAAFVVAGAAALGTAVYWFWPRSPAATSALRPPRLLLTAAPADRGGSFFISGSF